jgi:hypothetical protein
VTETGDDARPRLVDSAVRYQRTSDGFLLYDVRADVIYEGNGTGAEVLELMDGSRTCGELSAVLAGRFGIHPATALRDVVEFVAELGRQGLIQLA